MRQTGIYITSNTSSEEVRAFVPKPLPPKPPLAVDFEMEKQLIEANQKLAELDLAAKVVPSQEWLLYGFIRKEAVMTSQIEGTQSTLIDLLSSRNEDLIKDQDLEEVCNYIKAFEFAWGEMSHPSGLPLSLRLIRKTHQLLLSGTRGRSKNPGEFRTSQNWIGGPRPSQAHFVPPPPREMMECLDLFEKYLHEGDDQPLIKVALVHVQFETIHPFLDGNGRMGRLLITLLLRHCGLLNSPLLYLSVFFKKNRQEYYRLLNEVRLKGAWEDWVKFFLKGIKEVSHDAITASETLQRLVAKHRQELLAYPKTTVASIRLLEELPKKPVFDLNQAVQQLDLTKPPVSKAIKILLECGMIKEVSGRKRDRLYRYDEYLSILEEGTESPL